MQISTTILLDHRARAAARRDRRGPVRQADRPRRRAFGHDRRRRRCRCVLSFYVLYQLVWGGAPRRSTRTSTPGSRSARCRRARRLPDRPPDRDDDGRRHVRLADGARLHDRLHGRRPGLPALLQLHRAVHVLDADAGDEQQLPAAVLRLGSGGPGLVPADRLLVHAADARSSRTSRRSSSTASAISASCSASRACCTGSSTLDYAPVFDRHASPLGTARRRSSCFAGHPWHVRRPSSASACSSARWASRRRCRCTCGCRIRWKARRRSPR